MRRPMRYYGDPVLRQKAETVETIDAETKQLVKDLIDTMLAYDGVGLAATQIGVLKRIFVVRFCHYDAEGRLEKVDDPRVFINPELTDPLEELKAWPQGCLSIPKLYLDVIRPDAITCRWMDIEGKFHEERFFGYDATAIMHENDHLNGVLFIDRVSPKERRRLEPKLKEIKKRYYQGKGR